MYATESAKPAMPCSPTEARARELDDKIDQLVNTVSRLEDRLTFVLSSNCPTPTTGGEVRAVPASPIETVLEQTTSRVQSQTARLDALIDRLRI